MGTRGAYQLEEMAGGWAAREEPVPAGHLPRRQHQRQMERRRPLHADDLEGHDPRSAARSTRRRDWDFLICRYSPPGNVVGQRVRIALRISGCGSSLSGRFSFGPRRHIEKGRAT